MFLNDVEERESEIQSLPISRGTSIFRESIDGEADGIELLLCV